MTDETTTQDPAKETPKETSRVDIVAEANAALEARVTELETVVQALAHTADSSVHSVVLPWLEKISARIKAALGGA
jgi:hypothetical protein